jgi:hypothetical protein
MGALQFMEMFRQSSSIERGNVSSGSRVFGSERPGHSPGIKADYKQDVDRHAKNNVKHGHEQYGFLQDQSL